MKWSSLHVLLILLTTADQCSVARAAGEQDDNINNNDSNNNNAKNSNANKKSTATKVASTLAESILSSGLNFADPVVTEIRKQYWNGAFDEIRNLAGGFAGNFTLLNQWKILSDPESAAAATPVVLVEDKPKTATVIPAPKLRRARTPRFEGFPSWDRLLQDWAEDVQEYLEKAQADSDEGYFIGNFGRPATTTTAAVNNNNNETSTTTTTTGDQEAVNGSLVVASEKKKKPSLPIPVPAKPGEAVLPHTDVSDPSKRILIVTTASLPWRTGTAVNPLLRAAYLSKGRAQAGGSVTLMLPWLERPDDQVRVYGEKNAFQSPEAQEEWLRTWLRDEANMLQASQDLIIRWYTAWQNPVENSIYSMGDITALIPAESIDICILEEPEHLNWYRAPGESWTKKFKHVVGILHTNYFQYALDQPAALIRAPAMRLLVSWMCRAHCHRVIKLSGTLDKVAPEKELVENVHGVRSTFLDIGEEVGRRLRAGGSKLDPVFGASAAPSVYFIGKLLWSKGLGSLMELLRYAEESADLRVKVDMYGAGPDKDAAQTKASKLRLDMPFRGPVDHAELAYSHKIFVNPSTSEVLCTTSAEALAMGKFVILPSHPSNDYFAQFPNCLTYTSKEEFVGFLYYAMTHSPEPLTKEFSYALTWEAATERLAAAASIPQREAELMAEALESEGAGIEIALPPLVESEKSRKALATTLYTTRDRFRQFRSNLSNDVRQSKVLPKQLRERLANELDKRLELDIDEILESPKLRLQLSPGELDKTLLDLYDKISQSTSGDVLRVIGGGGSIGLQNLYMKRQAAKSSRRSVTTVNNAFDLLPSFFDDFDQVERDGTAAQSVRWALSRSLPSSSSKARSSNTAASSKNDRRQPFQQTTSQETKPVESENSSNRKTPSMCFGIRNAAVPLPAHWSGLRSPSSSSSLQRRATSKFSLLI